MFYNITKRYNRIQYKQGSFDINIGLDCISMILLFMKDMGKDVDGWIDGTRRFHYEDMVLTSTNFVPHLSDKYQTMILLKSFLKHNCITADKKIKGDILLFDYRGENFIGIYMGQNTTMCCFEDLGIKMIKINKYDVLEIYRWV